MKIPQLKSAKSFKDNEITKTDFRKLVHILKGTTQKSLLRSIEQFEIYDYDLLYHEGHLVINDDLCMEPKIILIVDGDLVVKGNYFDHLNNIVVITGDLKAKNIVTMGNLEVQGDIMAEEAILGDWYHAGAEVHGNVKCKLMYSLFHGFNIRGTLDAEYPIDISGGHVNLIRCFDDGLSEEQDTFVRCSNDVKEISLEDFKKLDVHDLNFSEPGIPEEFRDVLYDDFWVFSWRISKGKSIFKA